MYNITDYENVKIEEKNEKKKEETRIQYKKRIEILKKKKESNIHKYQQEIAMNQKKITNLQKQLIEVEKELEIEQANKNKRLGIPMPSKENVEDNGLLNNNMNNMNDINNNEEKIEQKNKEIKRSEDGSYENIISNEETNNINGNNTKEANGKEIFDAKDLSNINPMNAMNEISVDVPFVENEEKKNKKPEFLDEGFDDKKKEKNVEKDDKGMEIDNNEEDKKSKDENEEEQKKEEEKIQILNNIINNEPKDEDIEIDQLEEFQI